jgi:Glycosyl hydrolases family 2, sugar binding domain
VPSSDRGRRIWIEFDGVFRDAQIFVNGCYIGNSENGYVPFRFDLTDFLSYGAKNCVVVRVDACYSDGLCAPVKNCFGEHPAAWENAVLKALEDRNPIATAISPMLRVP